jgi:hypothetical protein
MKDETTTKGDVLNYLEHIYGEKYPRLAIFLANHFVRSVLFDNKTPDEFAFWINSNGGDGWAEVLSKFKHMYG